MKTTERRALIAKYENKIREATRKALTGETTDEWKADLSEIDSYAKLLALPEHRWTADAGLAVLFSLLCLFVAGTLWTLKRTHNNISLVLETHNLQAALTSPWSLQKELSSPLFFVERASTLSAPDLGLDLRDTQGDAWVRLDGGTISLENLELEKGTVLALTYSGDELSLFISGKPIRGTLAISGNGKLTAGTRAGEPSLTRTYQIGDGPPETLDFEVRDPGQVPLHIALHAPRSWALGRLALNNLNFLVEETRNVPEADFVSGIVSGTLTFNDVPWQPLTISEGDVLTIRDAGRAPVEIRGDKGIIQVTRSGVAGQVTLGLGEAKRQLAPSYLEYLYNQKKLSFFWGSAVGIWGVLWGIRKTIFR